MKNIRIYSMLLALISVCAVRAQEVSIIVTPTQEILPPQVGLYIENPQRYFNVTLMNNTGEDQQVFMGIRIDQLSPQSQLKLLSTARHIPTTPIVVRGGESKPLTMVELKSMFRYLPPSDVYIADGLYSNYERGIFGLMPEGTYNITLTAYRWQADITSPQVVSAPNTGQCTFRVCYNVQAPEWVNPSATGGAFQSFALGTLQEYNPVFSWTAPVLACNPLAVQFRYGFKLVEVLPGQSPEQAMDQNAAIYERNGLMATTLTLPKNYLSKLNEASVYAAQVTAQPTSSDNLKEGALNYVQLENDGKSTLIQFKLEKDPWAGLDDDGDDDDDDDDEGDDDDPEGGKGGGGSVDVSGDSADGDSLYVFSKPQITRPQFVGGRKLFVGEDLGIEYHKAWYEGGRGERQDTINFKYHVQLYKANPRDAWKTIFKQKPIKETVTEELETDFKWSDLEKLVSIGDYLVLRIEPECTNEKSIRILGDSLNVVDFAVTSRISDIARCDNNVTISNRNPLRSLKAGDEVAIGDFTIKVKTAKANSISKSYSGTGEIEWNPQGVKIMVQVKFDSLFVNTDRTVYDGFAYTYSNQEDKEVSSVEAVEELFSDWGVDNYMADLYLPGEVRSAVNKGAQDVAKQLKLGKYYNYIKTARSVWTDGTLTINNCYLPLKLPKKVNPTAVDLQIASMKFTHNSAQMNVVGEFAVPKSKSTDDVLIFGAPRLCMSPKELLPATGFVSLLADFKVKDPDSQFSLSFNTPTDVDAPVNGCFVSWQDGKFQKFHGDIDIRVPHLKRVVNDKAIDEMPAFNFQTDIEAWDNWIAKGTIPEFEAEDLPGWRFKAGGEVVYDHKAKENDTQMMAGYKWPEYYDYAEAGISKSNIKAWQGLYIESISVEFPKALTTEKDERLSIDFQHLIVDRSGLTFSAVANNLLHGKTSQLGGWEFNLKQAQLDVLQNNFEKCGFSGEIGVPILNENLAFDCTIYDQRTADKTKSGYAYVFKVQQMKDTEEFDFFLAQAKIDRKQTYFLLESIEQYNGEMDTSLELCMGGDMNIGALEGASKELERLTESLPAGMKLRVPGIHFTGMRIANRDVGWKSVYARSMQTVRDERPEKDAKGKYITWYEVEDKQVIFNEAGSHKVYFNRGKWSVSSGMKHIGPFGYNLRGFDLNMVSEKGKKLLALTLDGQLGLYEDKICGGAKVTIYSEVKGLNNIKSASDITNVSLDYYDTEFGSIDLKVDLAGIKINGMLEGPKKGSTDKGWGGTVDMQLKSLFTAKVNGGFYEHDGDDGQFEWGFFNVGLNAAHGIDIPPVKITGVQGGFYFNARRDTKNRDKAIANKGTTGVAVGLSLATEDGALLKGDFELTVLLKTEPRLRLTTFMLTGNLKGTGGLVDADASIVYEDNETDKYFQINVTADACLDATTLGKAALEALNEYTKDFDAVKEQLKEMAGEVKETLRNVTGGLADKIGEGDDVPHNPEESSKSSGMSAHVSIDFRITSRRNGRDLSSCDWHLWLGEPDESKRCRFTLIDFKSKIVTVSIGADAYLCLGSELPNNGALPAIPSKIASFLNGTTASNGLQSASLSQAERARTEAQKAFQADARNPQFGGGVMLGAKAWGMVDLDLGIIHGGIDAMAGFDVAIGKLSSWVCHNMKGGEMGWIDSSGNHWYGTGQIYAYLAVKLGVRIYLGFYNGEVDLADAAVGGLLKCGMPNPSWFEGQLRCKIRLLNGLFKLNRKFEFECGTVCKPFLGNALDNFQLFGDCDIAYDTPEKGFDEENIRRMSSSPIRFATQAPLNENFRLIDKNTLRDLEENYSGDTKKLEAQAKRTFRFSMVSACIYSFSEQAVTSGSYMTDSVTVNAKAAQQIRQLTFDPDALGENQQLTMKGNAVTFPNTKGYYVIEVEGEAKELLKGVWWSPEYTDPNTGKYMGRQPWRQKKLYFLRVTNNHDNVPEVLDLQEHVAIAYPSDLCNQLFNRTIVNGNGYKSQSVVTAYASDVRQPVLVMKDDDVNYAFQCPGYTTSLVWRLEPANGAAAQERANVIVRTMNGKGLNLTPDKPFTTVENGGLYRLKLIYHKVQTDNILNREQTELMNLQVRARESFWNKGGYQIVKNRNEGPEYERPFIGMRLESIEYNYGKKDGDTWRVDVGNQDVIYNGYNPGNVSIRLCDPYFYLACLGRWTFIGGRQAYGYDYDNLGNQSTEALVYTDKGGSWAGDLLGSSQNWNNTIQTYHETSAKETGEERLLLTTWKNIRNLTVYDKSQWSKFTDYPLPVLKDTSHVQIMQMGPDMTPVFNYGPNGIDMIRNLLLQIWSPYALANRLSDEMPTSAHMEILESMKKNKSYMKQYTEAYRSLSMGTYTPKAYDGQFIGNIRVPHYQFTYLAGGTLNHGGNTKNSTLHKSFGEKYLGERVNRSQDELVWYRMFKPNAKPADKLSKNYYDHSKVYQPNGTIARDFFDARIAGRYVKKVVVTCYRVDAYDIRNAKYGLTDPTKVLTVTVTDPFDSDWYRLYYTDLLKK